MSRVYEELDPELATMCNDVTLFSKTRGFFNTFIAEVVSLAEKNDWIKTFEEIPENEKITAVTENKELLDAITDVLSRIQPQCRGKDVRVSIETRGAAQIVLREGKLYEALSLACQAVLRAPMTDIDELLEGGVSLALALWVRSEILLLMGRPKAALEDLKLALKERLPAKMRDQYYWRLGHCYKATGDPIRAKVSYEVSARLHGSNQDAVAQLKRDIEALDLNEQQSPPRNKTSAKLTGGARPNLPAVSKLVRITEDENKGRYAVADSSIKTGDILLIDDPYAACLFPKYYGTHCTHCFKRFEHCDEQAPMWCPKCSGVAFCSMECRDAAVSTYHLYECPFVDFFIGSGMSNLSHIALRMVTQAGLDMSLKMHTKYILNDNKTVEGAVLNNIDGVIKVPKSKNRKERLNRAKKGLTGIEFNNNEESEVEEETLNFEESLELKAEQIYSLCTHSKYRKAEDFLKKIVMAMFLTECLNKANFFKSCSQENISQAQMSICELIVRNIQLLQFNAYEIYESIRGQHMFKGSKLIYIGVGIYPTGSLLNHECYPAVTRYFDGHKIVLRALRPIAAGDVVSENYGSHFLIRTLEERQKTLACRYWFRCNCIACREDWPTFLKMETRTQDLYVRCVNASCNEPFRVNTEVLSSNRCPRCSTAIDNELLTRKMEIHEQCLNQYRQGAQLMDEENPLEASAVLCKAVDEYHAALHLPHHETHIAEESLRSCFAIEGNTHIVRSVMTPD